MPSPKRAAKFVIRLQGWVNAMGKHPEVKRMVRRFGAATNGTSTTLSSGHPVETQPSLPPDIRGLGPGTSCHQEAAEFPNTKAMKRRCPRSPPLTPQSPSWSLARLCAHPLANSHAFLPAWPYWLATRLPVWAAVSFFWNSLFSWWNLEEASPSLEIGLNYFPAADNSWD